MDVTSTPSSTIFHVLLMASTLMVGCDNTSFSPITEQPSLIGVSLGQVAVATSDYDRIEELLTELEIPYTLYDGFVVGPSSDALLIDRYQDLPPVESLFENADVLDGYDVVFVNCGARGTGTVNPKTLELEDSLLEDTGTLSNLSTYVEDGGRLFVSDRSYTLLEAAFPELIDFQGDDLVLGAAEVGQSTGLTGRVVDSALEIYLNSLVVDLEFPVSSWAVPLESSGVLIRGDVPMEGEDGEVIIASSRPILIHLSRGYGSVTFTSAHNLPRVDQVWMDLEVYVLRLLADEV